MGAGYSTGATGGRISVTPTHPSRKGGPARPFLALGWGGKALEQKPSGQKFSALNQASPESPCIPQGSVLHLSRCHFFSVATAQAPSPPPSGQSLVKVPSASLCINLPRPTHFCPRSPALRGAT